MVQVKAGMGRRLRKESFKLVTNRITAEAIFFCTQGSRFSVSLQTEIIETITDCIHEEKKLHAGCGNGLQAARAGALHAALPAAAKGGPHLRTVQLHCATRRANSGRMDYLLYGR